METTAKYILPKKHLSWSQLDLWCKNKDRYRKEYFEGGEKLDTEALRFGKGFAESVEDGSYKEHVPDLHVYPNIEFKIALEIQGVPILSYLDSCDETIPLFDEYKTGRVPWSQSKVQKHDQLVFYATGLKALTGKMPAYCDLHWIETKHDDSENRGFWDRVQRKLCFTGKVVTYRRYFDVREVERMERLIVQTAREISEAYVKFMDEI